MKIAEMIETAEKVDIPSKDQLDRVACFALCAWGSETQLRYGYSLVRAGVRVYVRQACRGGEKIEREGADLQVVLKELEDALVEQCVANGADAQRVRNLIDQAMRT